MVDASQGLIYVSKAVGSAMQCSAANMQLASKQTRDAISMMGYHACQQANKQTSKQTSTQISRQASVNMIFIYELYNKDSA